MALKSHIFQRLIHEPLGFCDFSPAIGGGMCHCLRNWHWSPSVLQTENRRCAARCLLGREQECDFMKLQSEGDCRRTLVTFLGKVTEKILEK